MPQESNHFEHKTIKNNSTPEGVNIPTPEELQFFKNTERVKTIIFVVSVIASILMVGLGMYANHYLK